MTTARALFLCGGWAGHDPVGTVEFVAALVRPAGITVEVSESLAPLDDRERLGTYDVIVPCWTMGELGPDREAALTAAVREGTALAGWHGGMGDAFRSSTDYQFAVGGQFVQHPGDLIDYRVAIVDHDHPIVRGIDDFDVQTEQYYMHVDPSNHVLAETVVPPDHAPWVAGCRMPVAWTRRHGEGRVFYCSLGHAVRDLAVPQVSALVRRGIVWAAGLEPTP